MTADEPRTISDPAAERQLCSALLIKEQAFDEVSLVAVPDDFYVPRLRTIYAAMLAMWLGAEPIDTTTLAAKLREEGTLEACGGVEFLGELDRAWDARNPMSYARIVVEMAVRRRVVRACEEAVAAAYDLADVGDVTDLVRSALDEADQVSFGIPKDLWTVEEFLKRASEGGLARSRWVIPGQLRIGWRVVVIAEEGAGKTELLRQIAVMGACGHHPFTFQDAPPVRTLLVDLENPMDVVASRVGALHDRARLTPTGVSADAEGRMSIWHRPEGIDLRSRACRIEFDGVLARTRPEIVCMGPLYKCYSTTSRENDEHGAKEVQQTLDRLRARYGFALVLEHHAPKADRYGSRPMDPYGSVLWKRWPEFGLSLTTPTKKDGDVPAGALMVRMFRGPRAEANWPARIDRSTGWSWSGYWPAGMPNAESF